MRRCLTSLVLIRASFLIVSLLMFGAPAASAQTASISGTITAAGGGPLANVFVGAYRASGSSRIFAAGVSTNGSGVYTISGLTVADGPFFLVTSNQQSYIDQVYRSSGDRTCTMGVCNVTTVGTGIALGSGNVTGIDFALALGGRVGGTITDASGGAPIGNLASPDFVNVTLYDAAGTINVGLAVNSSGVYSHGSGLPAGNYFLRTGNGRGYIDQLYSGVVCLPATVCNSANAPTTGTPVAVVVGSETPANFALHRGGTLSGAITRASGGAAVTGNGVTVQIYNASGTNLTAAGMNSTTGLYALTTGLPAGTYYARTSGASNVGLVDQLYQNLACPGGSCTVTSGTPISITVGNNSTANFALQNASTISGTITSAASGAALNQVAVNAYRANGTSLQFVASTLTASDGTYSITIADPTQGPFFLTTYNTQGFVEQVYKTSGDRTCTMQACAILTVGSGISLTGGSATGIDFALAPGGRIGGTITDAVSGAGIANLTSPQTMFVTLVDGAGIGLITNGTNSSGAYLFESGIPAGNYYIRTSNGRGYVDQVYSGVTCFGSSCSGANIVANGTPIAVTVGNTATANLTLQRGATVSGTVTNATTGNPATGSGMSVQIYDSTGGFITSGSVNSTSGVYSLGAGLPLGNYFLRTAGAANAANLVDQLYNGLPCPNNQCTIISGTPLSISSAGAVTVNFALTPGATITGTVRNAATSAVLQSATIQVFNAAGTTFGSASSNASGVYTVRGLPAGTYYVRSSGPTGFVDEIFDNQTCLGCSNSTAVASATPVVVAAGATATADFDVVAGGSITGTITSGGSPVQGVTVSIVSSSNFTVRTATTNASGVFTAAGLPTGTYYARTSNQLGYINQVYNGVECISCNATTTGAPIAVTAPNTTSGIDFSLVLGGSVSGTITAATGGAAIQGVTVEVYTTTGTFISSAQTNASGVYTVGGLPTGNVTVRTFNSLGYLDQLHSGIPCLSCNTTAGTPVAVTAGSTTAGINFSLVTGGRISGRVTNSVSGDGAASVSLIFYTTGGTFAGSTSTSLNGSYTSPGLPAGNYVVYASGFNADLVSEIYDNMVCLGCGSLQVTSGTPVAVTLGNTTTGIDLALAPGAAITGTVLDQSGNPIVNATVRFFTPSNVSVGSSSTNALGVYRLRGMPPGTYYARTEVNTSLNYINQVWASPSNLVCIGCNATQVGAAIVVSGTTTVTGINFTLTPGASVSGTVTGPGGAALSGVTVQAYSTAGTFQRSVVTNSAGFYTLSGLRTGSYHLRAVVNNYVPQFFSGVNCVGCPATTGAPVALTEGSVVTGRDFSLVAGGSVTGTVTDTTGASLAGVQVSLTTTAGSTVTTVTTNSSGVYTISGLPAGSYFARTSNSLGYVNEVFDNVVCVGCAVTGGTPIVVTSGAASTANFVLAAGGRISGTVTDASTGAVLPGAVVDVYSAGGTLLTSTSANDAGAYTSPVGLPGGSYFVVFRATDYVGRVYNNIQCVGCSPTSGTPVTVTQGSTTSNINGALFPAGRVTGRILTSGGDGIEGVVVTVFDKASGTNRGSATSNASGAWAVNGLPAGTYTARTSNTLGYVDELYANSTCITCPVTSGAGFPVTAGQTSVNINFTLDAGARISGLVQNASSSPLAGVSVGVYDQQNRLVQSMVTTQLGTYLTSGLVAGRYYVRTTFNSEGYINQLYSALPCVNCAANTGTPVDVTGTATTANINFTLALGGSVSGTVTSSGSGLPGVPVRILNVENVTVATASTAANGTYTVTGLPAGTYWARTANTSGMVDQIYNGLPCLACSTTGATSFAVAAGGSVTGIDFALVPGGGISGTVTNAGGEPLSNVLVTIANGNGETIQTRTTDAVGQYATSVGLPAGTYYVRTTNAPGFINEAYNNVPCINCNPLSGTGVVVTSGNTTTGIDFSLAAGSRITGTVASSTGTPLEGVTVQVLTAQGLLATSAITNAAGTFRTGVLPSGSFYVRTRNSQGYTDQVYNGRECANCNPTLGTAVATDGVNDRTAIDFALVFGGRIEGAVRNAGGAGIGGVAVTIYTAGGVPITSIETDATGAYTTSVGLTTGTYYARTFNDAGYVDRIYNNVACIDCAVTTGTPISVTAGSPTTGIDFTLPSGGRISGTVLDGTTNQPIPGAFVNVFSSTGVLVTQALVGESGAWITPSGLAPGTYYARAASRLGYISKVWNNINCAACSAIIGTAITVTADTTTTGIDFSLVKGGKLSGVVTDATTGVPLRNVTIQTYDTANNLVTTSFTDAAGRFTSASGLPVGTYYVRTVNSLGYIDEVYNDVTCLTCLPNIGTAVVVGAGADITGIDFALTQGGKISGTIIETSTGGPLSGVQLRVVDAAGKIVGTPTTDSAGGYVTTGGLPAGTYYVRTLNTLGFLDEVYDNTVCTACDPRLGTGVVVTGTATTTGIDFSLAPGGGISGTVTAGDTGDPLGNVKVSVYNPAGSVVTTLTTDASGSFSGSGLAAGTYYLRTFNLLGYVDEAFGDVACAPCAVLSSTAVTVTAGNTTTGRNFVLARGGLVSGYVVDSVSNAALVGVTVSFYLPGTSTFVGRTLPTDATGYYAISLPAGTYDAQVDAVNGYTSATPGSRRSGRTWGRARDVSTVGVTLGGETSGVAFQLEACTPPAFSVSSLLSGRVGTAYSDQVTASGGTGGLTFALVDGALTPGLTLNASTGAIGGTPTAIGTANFTLAVLDASDCSATQAFAITTDVTPTLTGAPSALRFVATKEGPDGAVTAVTGEQVVTVSFTGSTVPQWTATSNQPWAVVSNGSGTGAGTFSVTVSNPANVIGGSTSLSAVITIAAVNAGTSGTVQVNLQVTQAPTATVAPIGVFDTPVQGSTVSGSIAVTGWALDDVGINRVEIWRDRIDGDPAPPFLETGHPANGKVFIANGTFVEGTRPDIESTYSSYPANHRGGWGYLLLTWGFPNSNGTFVLTAIAWDQEGNSTVLGTKTITVNNAAATKPFGSIDVPAYGGTFSGHNFTFGWALTPASGCTVSGGSRTMTVDSVPATGATPFGILYGSNRTDIASSFPGFSDSLGAGGAAAFDSRTYANGTYQIGWLVYDSCSNGEGIGSRFFKILNSGSDVASRDARAASDGPAPADLIRGRGPTFARVGEAVVSETEVPGLRTSAADPLNSGTPALRHSDTPLWLVRGLGEVERQIEPGATVWLSQTGRIEIHATRPGGVPVPGARYEGYLVANGVLRSLPLGSSFDARTGSFYWQPVAGFFGTYALRIDQVRGATVEQSWTVPIEVGPEGESSLLQVDHATCSTSACVVQGWSLDPQYTAGAGIGHVHVWAHKTSGNTSGGVSSETVPDIFVGAADLGGARPDVASRYGAQFGTAGYSLSAAGLPEGEWVLTVYAWSLQKQQWDVARVVHVVAAK